MKRTVILVREKKDAEKDQEELCRLGFDVFVCPLIDFVPVPVFFPLPDFDAVFFPSLKSVCFFEQGYSLSVLFDKKIFCVGEKSFSYLQEKGFKEISVFSNFEQFSNELSFSGQILYPCSNQVVKESVPQNLILWEVYEMIFLQNSFDEIDLQRYFNILVLSPSQARVLSRFSVGHCRFFCMGAKTQKELLSLGFKDVRVSKKENKQSLFELLCEEGL